MDKNKKEVILYLIFGVLTTLVDYVAAIICYEGFEFGELTSNNIAWLVAVIFAYITNKLFVFESKSNKITVWLREVFSFFGARILTLLMADVIIWVAALCSISFLIAKIISSIIVVIANYIFSKLFIFKKQVGGQ